jgi:hypothetical protein
MHDTKDHAILELAKGTLKSIFHAPQVASLALNSIM